MTEPYRRKLIEVSLPLAAINAESAREKSIRHGHPSTLHLWWARRPLAACRAVLFSSLVDDPDSDPQYRDADGTVDEESAGIKRADLFNLIEELVMWENSNNSDVIRTARAEIARCVASRLIETGKLTKETLVDDKTKAWDLVTKGHCRPQPLGLDKKVGRVRFSFDVSRLPPADAVNKFLAEYAPPVLDPFAGGGSIPLEAQRLGLRAFASDLNPVPVLINKALIEIPPKFAGRPPVNPEARADAAGKLKKSKALIEREWPGATGLAEDVRYYGKWMRDEAEKRIGHLYPKVDVTEEMAQDRPDLKEYVGQKLTVIAWLWARTVASPSPAYQGATVPLIRSFWLGKKPGKLTYLEPVVNRANKSYRFLVRMGNPNDAQRAQIESGTKLGRGCRFRCLLSDQPIPEEHIKREGPAGRLHSTMVAVVVDTPKGRTYLPSDASPNIVATRPKHLGGVDAPLANDPRNLWCLGYGLDTFDKLFTTRQLQMLTTFSDLVAEARVSVAVDAVSAGLSRDELHLDQGGLGAVAYSDAIATYLALGVDKMTDYNCTLVTWIIQRDQAGHAMTKQALPMVWDFAEVNPLVGAAGDITISLRGIARVAEESPNGAPGIAKQLDATATLGDAIGPMISTDPPYYDNIGYSDLSDFFYVWLRRSLSQVFPSLFSTLLTPKSVEMIATPYRHDGSKDKAQKFFEDGFGKAFGQMRRTHNHGFPLTVYYAFKQSEADDETEDSGDEFDARTPTISTGWETMLTGLVRAGFSVTGTWPMRTERSTRSVSMGTNVLASSIVLVCRPRPESAPLATRKEFLTALRGELPESLRRLQHGNIAPVDLAQSAIGPGMAVFTRYAKVLESNGTPMTVRTALGLINQTLDEVLAEQEGEFDSDTRWALSWFEQFGMDEGPFGDAETLSKAKNTAINGLQEAGIIVAKAGKVRLVKRDELPADWNPATDRRLTVWEITQHLIRQLDQQGETGAAELVRQLGGMAEVARDLAYRLYSTCERKKWAQDALAYNSLVVAWPELTKLALASRTRRVETQGVLGFDE